MDFTVQGVDDGGVLRFDAAARGEPVGIDTGLVRLMRIRSSPSSRMARAVRLTTGRTVMGGMWPGWFHVKHVDSHEVLSSGKGADRMK